MDRQDGAFLSPTNTRTLFTLDLIQFNSLAIRITSFYTIYAKWKLYRYCASHPGALYTKRNIMIDKLLGLQNQLRMYHWGTNSYAEHKALGKAYEGLDPLIDTFMETWMGVHGKDLGDVKLSLREYTRGSPEVLLNQASAFLSGELAKAVEGNTDLSNIRDEMLGIVNQTKYLLTLK